ncbi:hypothetical protein V8F20_000327 [Naviculisporaceae sp. PSN 640]
MFTLESECPPSFCFLHWARTATLTVCRYIEHAGINQVPVRFDKINCSTRQAQHSAGDFAQMQVTGGRLGGHAILVKNLSTVPSPKPGAEEVDRTDGRHIPEACLLLGEASAKSTGPQLSSGRRLLRSKTVSPESKNNSRRPPRVVHAAEGYPYYSHLSVMEEGREKDQKRTANSLSWAMYGIRGWAGQGDLLLTNKHDCKHTILLALNNTARCKVLIYKQPTADYAVGGGNQMPGCLLRSIPLSPIGASVNAPKDLRFL